MKNADVVVLGGSAAGITAALTARRHYPDRKVLLVRQEQKVLIPCGIPYIFGTVGRPDNNLIPDAVLEKAGVEWMVAEATGLDRASRILHTREGEIAYGKLILATGSVPSMPPIPGAGLDGVFAISKDVDHLQRLQDRLRTARDIVIIGGGFIGIEFADEIMKLGDKSVTVVELEPHCLSLSYDPEFCAEAEAMLVSRGVKIRTSVRVEAIHGGPQVESVVLKGGESLRADMVILGT